MRFSAGGTPQGTALRARNCKKKSEACKVIQCPEISGAHDIKQQHKKPSDREQRAAYFKPAPAASRFVSRPSCGS